MDLPETSSSQSSPVGIVEPDESFLEKYCIGAAQIVSKVSPDGTVPVRFQNFLPGPVTTQAKTVVAKFSTNVQVDELSSDDPHVEPEESCNATTTSLLSVAELFDLSHLEGSEREMVVELLEEFAEVVSTGPFDVGTTTVTQHSIQTSSETSLRQSPRRLPIHLQSEVRDHVNQLLDAGKNSPSNSPWAAPIVVVRKPDSSIRLCVDYRQLNKITVKDAYPVPRVDDTIDALSGSAFFSTFNLASGFWQVDLSNSAKSLSAFVTPFGLYEWNVMPFGLCNAPATFQRLMSTVLDGLIPKVAGAFIDDVISFSPTFTRQLANMRSVDTSTVCWLESKAEEM